MHSYLFRVPSPHPTSQPTVPFVLSPPSHIIHDVQPHSTLPFRMSCLLHHPPPTSYLPPPTSHVPRPSSPTSPTSHVPRPTLPVSTRLSSPELQITPRSQIADRRIQHPSSNIPVPVHLYLHTVCPGTNYGPWTLYAITTNHSFPSGQPASHQSPPLTRH